MHIKIFIALLIRLNAFLFMFINAVEQNVVKTHIWRLCKKNIDILGRITDGGFIMIISDGL